MLAVIGVIASIYVSIGILVLLGMLATNIQGFRDEFCAEDFSGQILGSLVWIVLWPFVVYILLTD